MGDEEENEEDEVRKRKDIAKESRLRAIVDISTHFLICTLSVFEPIAGIRRSTTFAALMLAVALGIEIIGDLLLACFENWISIFPQDKNVHWSPKYEEIGSCGLSFVYAMSLL